MSDSSIKLHPLIQEWQLENNKDLDKFFVREKGDTHEAIQCTKNRVSHLMTARVWISEEKIVNWSLQHPEEKVSTLVKGKAIERKLIHHENNMVVRNLSMLDKISQSANFIFEFVKHPTTVGSILPSSDLLAHRIVAEIPEDLHAAKRCILEVGPGTGAFTDKIIKRMNPADELHLVEFDAKFCQQLRAKYQHIPNVKIFQCSILDFQVEEKKYDFIISGLPLNHFECGFVEKVLKKFELMAKNDCKLSYFEYLVMADLKKLFSNTAMRANIDAIVKEKSNFYRKHAFKKEMVLINIPAARVVHHCIREANRNANCCAFY